MTIQKVNLGTAPSGTGGDTLRSAIAKINSNFTNKEHAANKLVGNDFGKIPMNNEIGGLGGTGWGGYADSLVADTDLNTVTKSGIYTVGLSLSKGAKNIPLSVVTGVLQVMSRRWSRGCAVSQILITNSEGLIYKRTGTDGELGSPATWTNWSSLTTSTLTYKTTTAASPNVHVNSKGELQRSTSTARLKKNIQDLVMTDEMYEEFKQLIPIFYQSTAEVDNPDWWYQSFNADAVGKVHPSLVGWEDTEWVEDEETGEQEEVQLEKRRAIGLNLNGIVAVIQSGVLYQAKLIEDLEKRIKDLESKK